ncbi:uncharacterized protein [Diadema setosum]|uniref:uncharacterized protein n=1 Tax=Diadema setosum TaxID=31175 RepID=UPI003B3BD739
MVYAQNSQSLGLCYSQAVANATCQRYPCFLQYLATLYGSRDQWAILNCSQAVSCIQDMDYQTEASLRVLQNKMPWRKRSFNMCQMVDFATSRLNVSFENALISASNSHCETLTLNSRFYPKEMDIPSECIIQMSATVYEVLTPSSDKKPVEGKEDVAQNQLVNMELGICTCSLGCSGNPCRHQAAVHQIYGQSIHREVPALTSAMRSLFYAIATGKEQFDLRQMEENPPSRQNVSYGMDILSQVESVGNESSDDNDYDAGDYDEDDHSDGNTYQDDRDADCQDLQQQLYNVYRRLKTKLEENPLVFQSAIKFFTSSLLNISDQSELVAALEGFGQGAHQRQSTGVKRPFSALASREEVQPDKCTKTS